MSSRLSALYPVKRARYICFQLMIRNSAGLGRSSAGQEQIYPKKGLPKVHGVYIFEKILVLI